MGILIQISQLILSLSILVFLHELGHYFFARLFKTRVDKFYLFFDPWFSLFKYKRGDTEWGIGWLPLGGYCKISGMVDESMDKEQLAKPAEPYEFRSKKAWQRLFIISGGVLVNFILALVIYSMVLYVWGEEYLPVKNAKAGVEWNAAGHAIGLKDGDQIVAIDGQPVEQFKEVVAKLVIDKAKAITVKRNDQQLDIVIPADFEQTVLANKDRPLVMPIVPFVVDTVIPDKPAILAGVQKGDKIISLNGIKTPSFNSFYNAIQLNKNKTVSLLVERDTAVLNFKLNIGEEGLIGAGNKPLDYFYELKVVKYSFFESIPAGIALGINTLGNYVKQLRLLFSAEGAKSIGGFGTIGGLFTKTWNWESFWTMTALLSIILAFMNVLPIPALDGGHIIFILYEMVTRRKPSDKFLEYAQMTGMILLLSLLLYANGNDIVRALSH